MKATSFSLYTGSNVSLRYYAESCIMNDSQDSDKLQNTSKNNAKAEENLVESSFKTEFEEEWVEVGILGLRVVKGLCNVLK